MTEPGDSRENVAEQSLAGLCASCGKPIRSSRKGSFTGWIFDTSKCKCAVPVYKEPGKKISVSPESDRLAVVAPASPGGLPDLGADYEVLELIGSGGMGSVYKVRDRRTDKTLALKVMRSELSGDPIAVLRFKQEARAAADLTHANLVPVFGDGQLASGTPYIVMDYIDGRNLAAVIAEQGAIEPKRALDICMQVCEVMDYAHKKGVIHRDLKPSNIMLTATESGADLVHLVDFGIAKLLHDRGETFSTITRTGEIFGSPIYMSPEQCQGEDLDERSDVYSFGCVMYEVLTGRAPFNSKNPLTTMLDHLQSPPPEFSTVNQTIKLPASLETLVMRCLEKSRQGRYQGFDEVRGDLASVISGGNLLSESKRASPLWRRTAAAVIDALIVGVMGAMAYSLLFVIGSPMLVSANKAGSYLDILQGMLPMAVTGGFVLGVFQSFVGFAPIWLIYDIFFAPEHQAVHAIYSRLCGSMIYLLSFLYSVLFDSSSLRATPGKLIMGLMLADEKGRRLSFKKAAARFFCRPLLLLQPFTLMAFLLLAYLCHGGLNFQIPLWLKYLPYFLGIICIIHLTLLLFAIVLKPSALEGKGFFTGLFHDLASRTGVIRGSSSSRN
ncbi:MAG: protein kinase [Candidatus Obscuribacterales bacterium]